jgi:hypothetical protein
MINKRMTDSDKPSYPSNARPGTNAPVGSDMYQKVQDLNRRMDEREAQAQSIRERLAYERKGRLEKAIKRINGADELPQGIADAMTRARAQRAIDTTTNGVANALRQPTSFADALSAPIRARQTMYSELLDNLLQATGFDGVIGGARSTFAQPVQALTGRPGSIPIGQEVDIQQRYPRPYLNTTLTYNGQREMPSTYPLSMGVPGTLSLY